MSLSSIIDWITGGVGSVIAAVWSALKFVYSGLQVVLLWALAAVRFIYSAIAAGFSALARAWKALENISHTQIWTTVKNIVGWVHARYDWINKYIFGPIVAYQNELQALWDRFILPIIKIFNDLERLTQVIGIFDRKLAAQIDQALWNLELKLTAPILRAMQRINALSSYLEGLLTQAGYLDRITQLSSIWRDAGLIRSILHNPYQQKTAPAAPPAPVPLTVQAAPFINYMQTSSGALAPDVDAGAARMLGYIAELG